MPIDTTTQTKVDAATAKSVKECLAAADRFIKSKMFDKAREEVTHAQKLDPSNVYIPAFFDRIQHFEHLHQEYVKFVEKQTEPSAEPPSAARASVQKPAVPVHVPEAPHAPTHVSPELHSELETMRKQILELSNALQLEKKAREEIQQQHIQSAVAQFRLAAEKAWRFGMPHEKENTGLEQLAKTLTIPENVVQSVVREVKLEMYSRAVKEVIAKRKLLKSSSSTLDWLRKVYQVTVTEYLEYESQFLLDLVTEQFRGTVLVVTSDGTIRDDILPRLKTSGYAVVHAPNPETALEKIEKLFPSVILCDLTFPEGSLSGIKFLHVLRANPKFSFLPFILFCPPDEAARLKSSELRSNEGVAPKPLDFDDLSEQMNEKLLQLREYVSSLG